MANTRSMERPGAMGQLPSLKTTLAVITGVMMLIDLYLIFMVAPTTANPSVPRKMVSIRFQERAEKSSITGVMMLIDLYLIFMVAPTDSVLGHVQRVFYFHDAHHSPIDGTLGLGRRVRPARDEHDLAVPSPGAAAGAARATRRVAP